MNPSSILSSALRSRFARTTIAIGLACDGLLTVTNIVHADAPKTVAEYTADPAAMLDAYRHVEAASVSDAIEQLLRRRKWGSYVAFIRCLALW